MDAKYLEEIEVREQAATPGPWIAESYYPEHISEPVPRFRRVKNDDADVVNDLSFSFQRPDADFIAHARADIPALLAEVERLTQARNYLQQLYDKLNERNENRSKQIATLKKALKLACRDVSEKTDETGDEDATTWNADYNYGYFIAKAQEQEEKK